jgi:putative two-component system response regulator
MNNDRKTIYLVDDNMTNLSIGKNALDDNYNVFTLNSGQRLLKMLEKNIPDLILLDIEMPEMNGYETIEHLKNKKETNDIPVIFLTASNDGVSELKGLSLGAVDYITKPFSGPLLLKRISKELEFARQKKELLKTQAELQNHLDNLEAIIKEKTAGVMKLQNAVLATVVDLVEFRDKHTGGHVIRTQLYLKSLIEALVRGGVYKDEMENWDVYEVLASAKLHDVGKIAVSDVILSRPNHLTAEEFEKMKLHVTAGVDAIEKIMSNADDQIALHHALSIAGTHHERWDGSGYPIGLKGKNIPLEGRLMAIADVYDALISYRPYKKAFSHEEACRTINEGAGTHFDPVLVTVFNSIEDEFKQIALKNQD